MNIVDSSAWLAYFADEPNAGWDPDGRQYYHDGVVKTHIPVIPELTRHP
jgi:hypothetical protein